jgi:uroporphyrinogen decarboxylase
MTTNMTESGHRPRCRARFNAALGGGPPGAIPLMDLGYWDETLKAWHEQGLPAHIDAKNSDAYFGLDGFMRYYACPEKTDGTGPVDRGMVTPGGWRIGLLPFFDEAVIEQDVETELVRVPDGTVVRRHRSRTALPSTESYTLVDRKSWEEHYVWRLNPDHPDRAPEHPDAFETVASDNERAYPLILPGGSLYGWLRNWLGFEQISMLIYDDPAWLEEMVDRVCDCIVGVLQRALRGGGTFDACLIWEDMAYNAGPMVSPATFKKLLSPRYRRITDTLRAGGVENIIVDSDGRIDDLIPLWLEAGVNTLMPIEIGTTGMDPVALRKRFGPSLRMIGGIDKRILWQPRDAIVAEIDRLTPLVQAGGFIPCCDHKVPPEVALDDYRYFLDTARQRWCDE